MIDVKRPLRKAYYELLDGNISVNGHNVPVSDDVKKFGETATMYVILSTQTGSDDSTFSSFDSQEDIILDIVFKSKGRTNKDALDSIATQILGMVLPVPAFNALPTQIGVDFHCVQLINDRYLGFELAGSTSISRRLLTFTQKVRQTGNTGAQPPNPDSIQYASQVTNEVPAGLVNGSNKIFTTAFNFIDGTESVTIGIELKKNVDYTVTAANQITFTVAPETGDQILIDYFKTP